MLSVIRFYATGDPLLETMRTDNLASSDSHLFFSRGRRANSILDLSVSTAVVASTDHCDINPFSINHFLKYRPILCTLTTNSNHAFISDLYQFKKHSFKMYTLVNIAGHILEDPSLKYRIYLRSSCWISSELYSLT